MQGSRLRGEDTIAAGNGFRRKHHTTSLRCVRNNSLDLNSSALRLVLCMLYSVTPLRDGYIESLSTTASRSDSVESSQSASLWSGLGWLSGLEQSSSRAVAAAQQKDKAGQDGVFPAPLKDPHLFLLSVYENQQLFVNQKPW